MRILSMFGSTLVLLAVAVDRYMAICHPFNALGKSRKQVHITVVIMWAFAAVLSLPQVKIQDKKAIAFFRLFCDKKFGNFKFLIIYIYRSFSKILVGVHQESAQ